MSRIPLDPTIQKILVVNFGGIGDELLFFPVIQSLREAYPTSRITALVEPRCQGIMAFNPAVDEVLTLEVKARRSIGEFLRTVLALRQRNFDLAIASGRSPVMPLLLAFAGARYRVGYDANRLAWTLSEKVPCVTQQYAGHMYYDLVRPWISIPFRLPQVALQAADRDWARSFLADAGHVPGGPLVILHPGTSRVAIQKGIIKTWEATRWAELARRLHAQGTRIVLAGGPDDGDAVAAIEALLDTPFIKAHGQTRSLGQMAALLAEASVLVSVDSAPLHLGVAVGTPSVAIFGPTDPAKLLPSGTPHQAVHVTHLPCRPCLWDRASRSCEALSCLVDLGVDLVEQAVWRVLPTRNSHAG
jgi:ADP-heptose:LPS heptosyltransferase